MVGLTWKEVVEVEMEEEEEEEEEEVEEVLSLLGEPGQELLGETGGVIGSVGKSAGLSLRTSVRGTIFSTGCGAAWATGESCEG